jgi:simple sugar transport system ATP-binding protein
MVPAIALRGIDKRFGDVHANKAVDLTVGKGSIHGIVGENGAGKSTLMSILYGFYEADAGQDRVNGKPVQHRVRHRRPSPRESAWSISISCWLTRSSVLDNVLLGAEGGRLLAPGARRIRAALARLAARLRLRRRSRCRRRLARRGSPAARRDPEGAGARGATSWSSTSRPPSSTPDEADQLFALLRALADEGKTVILITHKLREIMAVTDRVSVMRRGEMVATLETAATSPAELAELMVGRARAVARRQEPGPARPERARCRGARRFATSAARRGCATSR